MDLILDIETIANPKLPANLLSALLDNIDPDRRLIDIVKIEADLEKKRNAILSKFALSPLTGQIIGFSYAISQQPVHSFFDINNELEVLQNLSKIMSNHNYVFDRMVGYNIKGFDLPFIMARAAVHGVPFRKLTWSKYQQEYGVFDVMLHLSGMEAFGYISLQKWAMLFGIIKEPYESGGDIAGMVETGQIKEVIEKCERDVYITRELYKIILPTIGESQRNIILPSDTEQVKELIVGGETEEEKEKRLAQPPPKTEKELFETLFLNTGGLSG